MLPAALLAALVNPGAQAAVDVGVGVTIRQPGVYGRIEFGSRPPPPVIVAQPVIVAPPPVRFERRPIYLYVPPGQQRHWRDHCGRYAACGQPVYFVQERWVRERWDEAHPHRRHGKGEPRHGHRRGRDD